MIKHTSVNKILKFKERESTNIDYFKQLNKLAQENKLLEYLKLYVKYLESNNLISNCRIDLHKMLTTAIDKLVLQ